jgi:bifunctional UDP-N-acetylglucosamine pyrophosphorylase/glucosamine-1-phosphate N-acetyltransferase
VIILAAGAGKRMRSALPKVLQPLAGRPLLRHVINTARALSPQRICVVYGHGGDAVRAAFADEPLVWAEQQTQQGTGHAVQQALPHLPEADTALVLYGDVPLITPDSLRALIAAAGSHALGLMTAELANPTGYGRIVRDQHGRVTGIVEEKDATAALRAVREINTGILVAPAKHLQRWLTQINNHNAQGEYYLTDIVGLAAREGVTIVTARAHDEWETAGVNSKTQLAELERIHQQQRARALTEQGVTVIDPARLDVRGELICGRDVEIDVGCVFEGRVVLGDAVKIGAHSVLRDCQIGESSHIQPFSLIEGAQVGQACRIGPYARLRPGSVLGRAVHVGNFVELKNATFDEGSKANHLSYVGDASVGKRVNIGAGTITCNYDGAHKHRTVIEDDAFIGSDTQLVAPVTVGRGATLGAGTTLTRDAPAEALTVSRVKQITLKGWVRPAKKKD